MTRLWTSLAAACCVLTLTVVLGVRWFGPHDLYEKDQPKTMAYTADVVRHGRFSLPRDVIYQPATKPPLYNWVGVAVVKSTGVWSEWTLKFPSVLGTLATAAIVYAMARRSAPRGDPATGPAVVGLLAAGVWLTFGSDVRHGSVLRLSYLARPDMLLTALCTAAWAAFTLAIERPTARAAWRWAGVAWLCVTAAALTKGPPALLPVGYAVAYALFQGRGRRWAALRRLWLVPGLVVVVLGVGAWLACAYRQDPQHVRAVLVGAEVLERLTQTPEGFRKAWYWSAVWFVTKTWPWGAIATVGLLATAGLPRLRRPAGAAALYLSVVLIGLSIPAAKRMDYLLPAYAPAAVVVAMVLADVVRERVLGAFGLLVLLAVLGNVLAGGAPHSARWLVPGVCTIGVLSCLAVERRRAVPLAVLLIVPLALAAVLGRAHWTKSLEARNHWSDRAVRFVADVRGRVPAGARLLVLVRGKHPLATLLGRHQGSFLTPTDLRAADYVIVPEQADLPAETLSEPLPMGFDDIEFRKLAVLGLYRRVPLDRLVTLQKDCAAWTSAENPYHAPGTVYRDD